MKQLHLQSQNKFCPSQIPASIVSRFVSLTGIRSSTRGALWKRCSWKFRTGKHLSEFLLSIFAKSSILHVWLGSKYASARVITKSDDSESALPEAARRCSDKKVFRKYTENLQKNNHAKVWFHATSLKSRFDTGVLLQICGISSEHLFLRTPLESCFWLLFFGTIFSLIILLLTWWNWYQMEKQSQSISKMQKRQQKRPNKYQNASININQTN